MNKLLAFVRRDLATEMSYRFHFCFEIVSIVLSAATYYFLARFIQPALGASFSPHVTDYFAFVLVGLGLNDYQATALTAFSRSIRESQLVGTLEALLSTQTSLSTVILSSAAYPLLWTSFGVFLYSVLGTALFGVRLHSPNWIAAVVILSLSVTVFVGLGILSASFIIVFKRGSPVAWLFGALCWLLGGILYPVSVLPDWLQSLSALLPLTHAIAGMRGALLSAASWSELWPSVLVLLSAAVTVVPLGLASFHYATRWARMAGTLDQY
jgi:ABC-2 type transport system permease protein